MNAIARILRFVDPGEQNAKPSRYWRTRSLEERLRETLKLHHEGNELFKGGNPDFSHVMEQRHVPAR
ncbi:MAG: hypothetical protein QM601_08995 [Pseudoxanthomonas sp.]